jgi:hypothetical protein
MKNGSLQNLLASNCNNPVVPQVGMGATKICWTDRHPYTIVKIVSDREIWVQEDMAIRIDKLGMSDYQVYNYEPNAGSPVETLILKKSKKAPDGRWVLKGSSINSSRFVIGSRNRHYDYGF